MTGIELQCGELRLALRPDLGASIAGLWHGDLPVLRSTEAGPLRGPRDSACFALAPYSNRLAGRRFHWQGRSHDTAPNFDDSPHSLHGVAWQRAWQVTEQDARSATLVYRHAPDAHWPFAFALVQRFELHAASLALQLRLTNTDASAQPVGLGWHPYFPRRAASRLAVAVGQRWAHDALQIPTEAVPQADIDAEVATLALDHCFGPRAGAALIEDDHFTLRLDSSLPYLVLFTPAGKAHFCVEPVSHVNDAIHAPDPAERGLITLRPGETAQADMTLDIERR